MTSSFRPFRAALLGLTVFAAGCDVAAVLQDPTPPIFEQTWNVPAKGTSISVASLLPPKVGILSDSSAFSLQIDSVNFTRRVGADCAQCETLNGTFAPKPQFTLVTGSSTSLPGDIVSGAIVGGSVRVLLTNSMSFDPLRARTAPGATQGHLVMVVRSGSVVLGRDSINGATTPFAPGTTLTRNVGLTTGTVTGAITVDVTLFSPLGDHNEFIDANGTLRAIASVPALNVASVSMNVNNRTMSSGAPTALPLDSLPDFFQNNVVRGAIELSITNPFAVSGTLQMRLAHGPGVNDAVNKSVTISGASTAPQVQKISFSGDEMSKLLGNKVDLTLSGGVNSTTPITVTPRQVVSISERLILTVLVGGEN